jgi:hypothetical protein
MMAEYNIYAQEEESVGAFVAVLFKVLSVTAMMFIITFLMINPEEKTGKIDTNAEFIVTVTWPDNHPDDIDTYVQDPNGQIVWYHAKEAGLLHLDRDDRGMYRDTILVNGTKISNPLNQETVTMRGIVPGEYTVNVFHYLATGTDAVPVNVKVEKVNPQVEVIYYTTVELHQRGQEETIVRYTVEPDGSVSDVNFRPQSLVRRTRKAK